MGAIIMVCKHCGSEDVKMRAWAVWNVANQTWELDSTFDQEEFCENCNAESPIEEKENDAII